VADKLDPFEGRQANAAQKRLADQGQDVGFCLLGILQHPNVLNYWRSLAWAFFEFCVAHFQAQGLTFKALTDQRT
jgi:hypothetical protein